MRCIFDNKVLSVIERNRMREKSDWSVAPEAADDPRQRRGPINGVNGIPSLRASPRSEGHEPLISPASSPASIATCRAQRLGGRAQRLGGRGQGREFRG